MNIELCRTKIDTCDRIVVVSGVMDVLHFAHFSLLKYASQLGDYLLVGINSDRAVKLLKGDSRPIHNERQRAQMLMSLTCVDEVRIVDDITMTNFLLDVKPSIWVKGRNQYTLDTLNQNERKAVEDNGGSIVLFDNIEGLSSSRLIKEYNLSNTKKQN